MFSRNCGTKALLLRLIKSYMIRNLLVLNIAEMFERFTYYGVRSIFILYLCYGLDWDKAEASEYYGTFTMIVYVASLVGGVLSDRTKKPALIAIIGNSLTTVGTFMLAFAESPTSVYITTSAIAIGGGLFKPSLITTLYRVSFTHKHRFDLIFTIFHCAINLGAFAAPLVIASFGDMGNPDSFRTGFLVVGCFSLIPTILLYISYINLISNDLYYDNQTYRSSDIGITNIILWFFLAIIFWLAYELFPALIEPSGGYSSTIIMAIAGFIFYMVVIPLHLIRNFRSALKISIGLLMVALVCLVYPLLDLPPVAGLIMLSIAEVLIIPVLWSQIVQNVSPRFTGMVISVLMFMTLGINKAAGVLYYASQAEQPVILFIIAILCVALMAAFLLLDHFQKKREQNLPHQMF